MSKRTEVLVSILLLTRNRSKELEPCIESILRQDHSNFELIIVNNGSSDNTQEVVQSYADYRIRLLNCQKNLGVSGGRNRGLRHCRGDIIIILDDDTEILNASLVENVAREFQANPAVGALAFRIIDYESGSVKRKFFPSRNKNKSKDAAFETSWLIGAGHALSRNTIDKVGLYRDFRPYGSEEFDYSLRIMDAGLRIFYFPEASIIHKESPRSRLGKYDALALSLEHRLKAAALNLPLLNVISFIVIRSLIALIQADFRPRVVLRAWQNLISNCAKLRQRRAPISVETYRRIRRLGGNVFF